MESEDLIRKLNASKYKTKKHNKISVGKIND